MNHPYLYPEDAPWTEEFRELQTLRRLQCGAYYDEESTEDDIEASPFHSRSAL